jgi:hypothetical protein
MKIIDLSEQRFFFGGFKPELDGDAIIEGANDVAGNFMIDAVNFHFNFFEFSANGGLILIDASVAEISQMMAS